MYFHYNTKNIQRDKTITFMYIVALEQWLAFVFDYSPGDHFSLQFYCSTQTRIAL